MSTLTFSLTLQSDGEIGSGLGGELVDGYVTRDHAGLPVIRASHLKGLMREQLTGIVSAIDALARVQDELVGGCFGRGGDRGDAGVASKVRVSSLTCAHETTTVRVTRTALNDYGSARQGTLRCDEAVAVGTVFTGTLTVDADAGSPVDLAARLALVSVDAVGGNRTRGAGACLVEIDGEHRKPGELLRNLAESVQTTNQSTTTGVRTAGQHAANAQSEGVSKGAQASGSVTWLRLVFTASSPMCSPEIPVVSTNAIRTGIAIPASAVQGVVLHRLANMDDALATTCHRHPAFRSWPLLPWVRDAEADLAAESTRVSLTHRISKLPLADGSYKFLDSAIEPYDWREMPEGSPLKAADGVLLRDRQGRIRLWRAAEMPREISAHGVHDDGQGNRNLFTVESMVPMTWVGVIAMPANAAAALSESLRDNGLVTFGKARSVRGAGKLTAELLGAAPFTPRELPNALKGRVFIAQSPLVIPDEWDIESADDMLQKLVGEVAQWGAVDEAHATAAVRFGWSNHPSVRQVGKHQRLRARRCILPGAVFVLRQPLENVAERLVQGIGAAREEGFGAVVPHPGRADSLYRPFVRTPRCRSRDVAGRLGLQLWQRAAGRGPSPSQIAAVGAKLLQHRQTAIDYLERQRGDRPERVWRRWKQLATDILHLVRDNDAAVAVSALRVWQDLAIAEREQISS